MITFEGPIKKLVILKVKFEGFSPRMSKLRKQPLNTLMDVNIHDNYLKKLLKSNKNLRKFGSFNLKRQTKPTITKIFINYDKIIKKNGQFLKFLKL